MARIQTQRGTWYHESKWNNGYNMILEETTSGTARSFISPNVWSETELRESDGRIHNSQPSHIFRARRGYMVFGKAWDGHSFPLKKNPEVTVLQLISAPEYHEHLWKKHVISDISWVFPAFSWKVAGKLTGVPLDSNSDLCCNFDTWQTWRCWGGVDQTVGSMINGYRLWIWIRHCFKFQVWIGLACWKNQPLALVHRCTKHGTK